MRILRKRQPNNPFLRIDPGSMTFLNEVLLDTNAVITLMKGNAAFYDRLCQHEPALRPAIDRYP